MNQARYRAMNEAIRGALDRFHEGGGDGFYDGMCECAVSECSEMITLPIVEYDHVRSNAAWFMVRPEHMMASGERVLEEHGGYWIIEKTGHGRDVAEAEA